MIVFMFVSGSFPAGALEPSSFASPSNADGVSRERGPEKLLLNEADPAGKPGNQYRITPGDVISINVFPAQEFSRELTVQPDGTIEMPLIGSMRAKELTANELSAALVEKLAKFIANPQVTVNVRRFTYRQISIIGEVKNPGYYEYKDGMKMLDIVARANGLADYARASRVKIFRYSAIDGKPQQNSTFTVNFKAVLDGKLDRDVILAAGDIIYVPRKPMSTGAKWISDNFVPWASLITFAITLSLVSERRR